MWCRVALPFGLPVLLASLLCCPTASAQSPLVSARCSRLIPMEAGVTTLRSPGQVNTGTSKPLPHPKVVVERVEFDGPIQLPYSVVDQAIADFNRWRVTTGEALWVDHLAEIGLRGALQNRGYFRAKVTAGARSLGGDSSEERFLVTAHIDEGSQYHLGDIRFVRSTVFPEHQLREAVPLRDVAIFDVSLVREGMEQLRKLYSARGYIDFTATPETNVDDWLERISLVFRLDEQPQFRIGSFSVLGLDPSLEAALRSIIRPGEYYNQQAVHDFLRANERLLPPDAASDPIGSLGGRRITRTGILDLVFDARPCSATSLQ